MSDNLKRYSAIKAALVQLYPQAPTGRRLQALQVLAMMINGIAGSQSTHLRQIAKKTPTAAQVTSREKQLSRWYQNEQVSYELHMLPFVKPLLAGLAAHTLVLAIDGSEVGRNCVALIVSLIYQLADRRNQLGATIRWQFTVDMARTKFKRFYPNLS